MTMHGYHIFNGDTMNKTHELGIDFAVNSHFAGIIVKAVNHQISSIKIKEKWRSFIQHQNMHQHNKIC